MRVEVGNQYHHVTATSLIVFYSALGPLPSALDYDVFDFFPLFSKDTLRTQPILSFSGCSSVLDSFIILFSLNASIDVTPR